MASKSLKIIQVSVEDLIPYVNNSRTHSDKQIDQIGEDFTGKTAERLTDYRMAANG